MLMSAVLLGEQVPPASHEAGRPEEPHQDEREEDDEDADLSEAPGPELVPLLQHDGAHAAAVLVLVGVLLQGER